MNTTDPDRLVSRVVDRVDQPQDWAALDQLAEGHTELWSAMLLALRQDAVVRAATEPLLRIADRVDVPLPRRRRPLHWFGHGWLVAAVLAGLWAWSAWTPALPTAASAPVDQSQVAASKVVGDLGRELVEARPADGGGYEVVYVRRVLERAVVPQLFELASNERGQPVAMPVKPSVFVKPVRY